MIPLKPSKFDSDELINEEEFEILIDKIMNDTQLHKLLSDEKMRTEIHKSNYNKLKTEFKRALHQIRMHSSEITRLEEENAASQETYLNYRKNAEKIQDKLTNELEEVRKSIPTTGQMIEFKDKERSLDESSWISRVNEMIDELESSKNTIQNLMKDNLCLRHAYQHSVLESESKLEELRLTLDGKIKRLEKINSEILDEQRPHITKLEKEILFISQEKSMITQKFEFLSLTYEQSEQKRKELEDKVSALKMEHGKIVFEHLSKISKLETNKTELRKTIDRQMSELETHKSQLLTKCNDITEFKKKLVSMSDRILEIEHEYKNEIDNSKCEFVKEKAGLTIEIDVLRNQLKEMTEEMEKYLMTNILLKNEKTNAEQELNKHLNNLTEQANLQWNSKTKDLESQCKALEKEKVSLEAELNTRHMERNMMLNDLHALEKENDNLKEIQRRSSKNDEYVESKYSLSEKDIESSKKVKVYGKIIKKLRQQLQEAHNELKENDSSNSSSLRDKYIELQNQYRDLKEKQQQFSQVLNSNHLFKIEE